MKRLIKIELWQIEDSNPAPKFEIIVSPNEWAKAIKTNPANGELTNTKLQQLEFWNRFKDYVRGNDTRIRLRTPRPQHWYDVSMGSSEAHVVLTVNSRENFVSCEIYINNNKDLFNFLQERKHEIEGELGTDGNWWSARRASGMRIKKEVEGNVFEGEKFEGCFAWLYEKTILFQKVFGKYLKEFKE